MTSFLSMSLFHRDETWVPTAQRDRINPAWIACVCANQLTACFIWTPIGVLTNPYCQKLGLNNVAITFVLLIGSIVGIIVPPFVAVWSDTTEAKMGRRRPWMISGEILVLIGLMMTSFCRELSPNSNSGAIAVFVIGQILASVGGNTLNGPGRTMCSDVCPPSQQVLVANVCQIFNGLAGVISNLIGALELYKYTKLNNETLVLMISCIIGFVSLCISCISAPEEPLKEKPEVKNPFSLIGASFKFYDKQLGLTAAAFLTFQLGVGQFSCQNANFIARKVFGGEPNDDGAYDAGVSHAMMLALIQTVVQVVFSFMNTSFVNLLGLKWAWCFGTVCACIADIIFFFVLDKWVYAISYVLMGIVQVTANSIPYALISLVTPSDKLAGVITVMILFGNIAGVIGQFALTMGLGSVEMFKENTGLLIGVSFGFEIIATVFGLLGIKVSGKNVKNEEFRQGEKDEASSSSSVEKPEAL